MMLGVKSDRFKNTPITILLGLVLVFVLIPISVYGATDPYILLDSNKGVGSLVSDVRTNTKNYADFDILYTASGNTNKLHLNKSKYNELSAMDKRDVMEIVLTLVNQSNLASRDKSRLYNFIEEQDSATTSVVRALSKDTSTDIGTASSIVRPFTSPLSTFLGVMSILIFFMLAVSITIDVFFLSIPMFQFFLVRDDSSRPKVISQEAWDALLIAESNTGTGDSVSVWGTYFKNRSKTMILVGLTLGYLIAGRVFDLAVFLMDLFERMLG